MLLTLSHYKPILNILHDTGYIEKLLSQESIEKHRGLVKRGVFVYPMIIEGWLNVKKSYKNCVQFEDEMNCNFYKIL